MRERAMRCGSCGQQNREGARFCDACGARLSSETQAERKPAARECISCGKTIDLGVYFTVCPHCGFNYRIEITPVAPELVSKRGRTASLYVLSIAIPMAGFVIGALLSHDKGSQSRRVADGCVALGAINIIVTPILILKFFGLA
jgi:predicted amidophosphoribosyltransferase